MAALMFVNEPNYSAIIFRKTYADLSLPGALMDRAAEWLAPTAAKWNEREKTWRFPSGATLSFGYLDGPRDRFRYQGAELQFIGFDEATQIREEDYLYLFSRLRRLEGQRVPLRMRAASNPGGESHGFFHERFVSPRHTNPNREFIPALLEDNPHLDRAEYERSLEELPDTEYRQLRLGEWIQAGEQIFEPEWFDGEPVFQFTHESLVHINEALRGRNRYDIDDYYLKNLVKYRWLSYDTAFKDKDVNDATGILVWEMLPNYLLMVRHAEEVRLTVPDVQERIEEDFVKWNRDEKLRGVIIEDKGSGISILQTLQKANPRIAPYLIPFEPKQDSKEYRARQAAVWLKRDCVWLPESSMSAPWLYDFEEALFNFPYSRRKDAVDAFTQFILYMEPRIARGWRDRNGFNLRRAS
jgi:phage terminase large subunit-like protein